MFESSSTPVGFKSALVFYFPLKPNKQDQKRATWSPWLGLSHAVSLPDAAPPPRQSPLAAPPAGGCSWRLPREYQTASFCKRHTIKTMRQQSQSINKSTECDSISRSVRNTGPDDGGQGRSGFVESTKTLRGTHMMDGVFSHLPPPGWLGKTSSRKKYT